jgi:hypothetical protein
MRRNATEAEAAGHRPNSTEISAPQEVVEAFLADRGDLPYSRIAEPKPLEKLYHVFTHGHDEWLESYDEAVTLFNQWAAEYGSTRLYEEYWENRQLDDDAIKEDCLLSFGSYPW